jgi:hypothetical protein
MDTELQEVVFALNLLKCIFKTGRPSRHTGYEGKGSVMSI